MIKIIQFLEENKHLLALLKEDKLSLVGVNELEQQAIVEAFEEGQLAKSTYWRS